MAEQMKRAIKEDNMWDCSVCTYRNSPEAFKCLMCDVRKGTSTRKPRLNAELVAAQVAQVLPPKPKKTERTNKERKYEGRISSKGRPRLKNVDRSTAEHNAVTVNNVTVIITEFQPKQKNSSPSSTSNMAASSSGAHSHHDTNSCDSIISSSAGDSRASAAADVSAMSVDSESPGKSEPIA